MRLTGRPHAVIKHLRPKLFALRSRDFRISGSEFGLVFEPGKWDLFWAPNLRYAWYAWFGVHAWFGVYACLDV